MTISARATYVNGMVSTASPARLLLLLCDRLRIDVQRAIEAQEAGLHDEAGKQLMHAQDIVVELKSSLDLDAWEGGPTLSSLYDWIHRQLIEANIKRDARFSREALTVIEPLVEAWHEAALSAASA